jgi:NADH-quinone oxidoreductase subunit F
MLNGGDEYAKLGEGRSKGTKLIALAGHVKRPGTYELEWAKYTFRDLFFDPRLGGGIRDDNELKVIIPGGASSPWLGPEHLDTSLSNEALAAAGSMAGSASIIPMDQTTCVVRAAWRIVRFFHRESCGQCTPCREGGGWLERILERIESGQGRESDLDLLMDVCDNISPGVAWPPAQTTICVLGPSMPPAVAAGIRMFRDEYLDHVRQGRCPFPPDRLPRRLARV